MDFVRWLREAKELHALKRAINRIDKLYDAAISTAKRRGAPQEEQHMLEVEQYGEVSVFYLLLDILRTKQAIRRAIKYGVPIPKRNDESDFWNISSMRPDHLTDHGFMHIRREIAIEVDIQQKPWLNWLAVAVSFLSFGVAVVALFYRSS